MNKAFLFLSQLIISGYNNPGSAKCILLPFRNPSISVEERVNDLVSRMTLKEKADQLLYTAPAIPRLGIP